MKFILLLEKINTKVFLLLGETEQSRIIFTGTQPCNL